MGLGYEGWIKLDDTFALGTGMSVPRARSRLESSAGYGGQIESPVAEIGIGQPFTYDWDIFDGNASFDVNELLWDELINWVFHRQTAKEVKFSTRSTGVQRFERAFWNSININANDGSQVDGSVSFVAIDRDEYVYGREYPEGKEGNDEGGADQTLLCPLALGMGAPLNPAGVGTSNLNPIPYWNTFIEIAGNTIEFINWSLSFSQDVVKFFECGFDVSTGVPTAAVEPKYLAVGPMTVSFSGNYMMRDTFLGDEIVLANAHMGTKVLELRRMEASTESDDLPGQDSLVPLAVDYSIYELAV